MLNIICIGCYGEVFLLTTLIYSHVIRAGHHFMFMFIHIFKVFFCLFEYSLWCWLFNCLCYYLLTPIFIAYICLCFIVVWVFLWQFSKCFCWNVCSCNENIKAIWTISCLHKWQNFATYVKMLLQYCWIFKQLVINYFNPIFLLLIVYKMYHVLTIAGCFRSIVKHTLLCAVCPFKMNRTILIGQNTNAMWPVSIFLVLLNFY